MDGILIEHVRAMKSETPGVWLVKQDGNVVGLLEKYLDTRTDKHPWKAFRGTGVAATFLGAWYPSEGGQLEAINAILDNRKKAA